MNSVRLKSYAKINLTLEVEGRRADGYHNLNTVMQTVSLCDLIKVSLSGTGGISIKCNLPYVPCDERNIAYKAAVKFYQSIRKIPTGIDIEIEKHIPVGAGLAGGSSNGGAVLMALNQIENNPLSGDELLKIGAQLGADVPFTMIGGCAVAYGLGYELEKCVSMPQCYIVLCKPRFSVSTKWAFESLIPQDFSSDNPSLAMVKLLESGSLAEVAGGLFNSFERCVVQAKPEIFKIKGKLLECGALGTLMSGTGSTVYGVFNSFNRAQNAQRVLRRRFADVFIVKPL